MTATENLAVAACAEQDPLTADYLRALTLTNLAAAVGVLGRAGSMIDALPLDPSRPGDLAYLLAMRLHARTQDDFYPRGRTHIGAVTTAATLALADHAGDRGLECLTAGYQAGCIAAAAYSEYAQRRGYRPTGIFGPLGAAAAAAAALELGPDGIANAIGLAAATSAGTMQAWVSGTDEWLLEVGAAARSGVEAALMTQAGITASPVALEGAAGWARAYFDDADARALMTELEAAGSRVVEVATKPYPVSGIAQVPTRLAADLHAELGDEAPEKIAVGMSEIEYRYPGSASRGPFRSRSDALMSVAFCVACALREGAVRLERLEHPNDAIDPRLIAMVEVRPDTSMPENQATLEVTAGGNEFRRSAVASDILFPSWDRLAAADVARRTEADPQAVERIRDCLDGDVIDAGRLLNLIRWWDV